MRVVVGVPFRAGLCGHRKAAWVRVREHLTRLGWPIIEADDGGEPFSRGVSLNSIFETTDADVVIGADADTLIPHGNLRDAAEWAFKAPGLVQPFSEWIWCGESETARILEDNRFPRHARGIHRMSVEQGLPLVGTCNVLSRETWELAGGWLPGFRGWGCEDIAFAHQCATLAGPLRRIPGPAVHLYHPKTGRYVDDDVINANSRLMREVHAVAGNPDGMRALIAANT